MKKRNLTALAMGIASTFLITTPISAEEESNLNLEARSEENREIARGGCGNNCSGGNYRSAPNSSPRDRRYGGNLSQKDYPSENASCGGGRGQPQGSCHNNGNPPNGHCNGYPPPQGGSCNGNGRGGGCHGYSNKATQEMKNKRTNVTNK